MILLTIISLTALGLSIACIMKTERYQFLYQDGNNVGLKNMDYDNVVKYTDVAYKNVVKYTDIFNIKNIGKEDDNVYLTNCGNKTADNGCYEPTNPKAQNANASYFGPKHTGAGAGELSEHQEYQLNKVNN